MNSSGRQLFWIGISILFIWSLFLRFYHLGQVPNGLYWDETAILLDAKSIAESGKDIHSRPWYQVIFPSYGDYKLPVYIWVTALSTKVVGVNELAVRLPNAVAGIGTVLITALLIKELLPEKEDADFKKMSAMIGAVVVAISPWSIVFSRTGFESHLAQFLLASSFWLALKSRQKRWLLIPSVLVGVLSTYTYFSVRYVWLSVFILLSWLFLIQWKNNRALTRNIPNVFLYFVLPLVIFSVGLLPMLKSPLYEASNTFRLSTNSVLQNDADVLQSNVYTELAGNKKFDRVFFYRWWLTGKKLLANYSDNMSLSFLFVRGDPNLRHGTGQNGLFLLVSLPFFGVGWYVLFRKYPKVAVLLLVWWLMALLPASVPNTTPHAQRSLNALVPLAIVIAVGLSSSIRYLRHYKSTLQSILTGAGFLLIVLNLFQFSHFYCAEYPSLSNVYWQAGFKTVAQSIYLMRKQDEPTYVLSFDDRFYLWLLLYGPYSTAKIQAFHHHDYQIREFDKIYTDQLPNPLEKSALLVGSPSQIDEFAKSHQYQIIEARKIALPVQPEFEVAQVSSN